MLPISPCGENELLKPALSKLRPKSIQVLSGTNTLSCNKMPPLLEEHKTEPKTLFSLGLYVACKD